MILATLCYVKRDGHTLMIHRNKRPNDIHEGKWNGLGGKFEAGESPEDCGKKNRKEIKKKQAAAEYHSVGCAINNGSRVANVLRLLRITKNSSHFICTIPDL